MNDEILSFGEKITRRLYSGDKSFTITFLSSRVQLSFDTGSYDCEDGLKGGPNVSITLYQDKRLASVSRNGRKIVHLRNIHIGNEVTVECFEDDSQNLFFIEWKGDVIAVQYCD